MSGEKIGGVPVEVLEEIAKNSNGTLIRESPFGALLVLNRGHRDSILIAPSRLGISEAPDRLGTVTTRTRYRSTREALGHIDSK